MIKIVLLFSLFSACGLLGINIGKAYTEKYDFYKELYMFCNNLKNDISFLKTDILSIIEKNNFKSKLANILNDIKLLLKKNTLIKKNEILEILDNYAFLNEQDKVCLSSIFSEIGTLGYEEELAKIEYNITNVEIIKNDYKQNKLKFAVASKKIGFLVGLLVCIVLI